MTKREFVDYVLMVMNEAQTTDRSDNFIYGADSVRITDMIASSYIDAWKRCTNLVPRMWYDVVSFVDAEHIFDVDKGTGYVILPDNYYMLSAFRMNGWQTQVIDAPVEDVIMQQVQTNEFTRGNEIRPVCTVTTRTHHETGYPVRVLNYYSVPKGREHVIDEAFYVRVPVPLSEMNDLDNIDIGEKLLTPLAHVTASTVYMKQEKYDIAQVLLQMATEMIR